MQSSSADTIGMQTVSGEGETKDMSESRLTLAITKIGDLLLWNKISKAKDSNPSEGQQPLSVAQRGGAQDKDGVPIEGVELKIPEYQRPYKWTTKNASQLLDDILDAWQKDAKDAEKNAKDAEKDAKEAVYRVGTLILHKADMVDENGTKIGVEHNIVDGQQRIITFSLLLRAIGEAIGEHDEIRFLQEEIPDNPISIRNVRNNYALFERRIAQYPNDKLKEILGYIKEKCELIVVITNNVAEAFQFFDSQNVRGKKLYPHDLLKAYHLRKMSGVGDGEKAEIVKTWEERDQARLSVLFNDYLYRIKCWIKGNMAYKLNESTLDMFKGVSDEAKYPYAQFYWRGFNDNQKEQPPSEFQLDAPVLAGEPFFRYATHYFDLLSDVRCDNEEKDRGVTAEKKDSSAENGDGDGGVANERQDGSAEEGTKNSSVKDYIKSNPIFKTLEQAKYKAGVGNNATRLLFDASILLYVDRFCGDVSDDSEKHLQQFIMFAFIWAYSLRAQYKNLGWVSAQNYIMGKDDSKVNAFNLFKVIVEASSPGALLSELSDKISPLEWGKVNDKLEKGFDRKDIDATMNVDGKGKGKGLKDKSSDAASVNDDVKEEEKEEEIYKFYLHYFKEYKFLSGFPQEGKSEQGGENK